MFTLLQVSEEVKPRARDVDLATTPDYLQLLRNGRRGVRSIGGAYWRGWRNGSTRVWVAIDPAAGVGWDRPKQATAGHGLNIRVTATTAHFHLVVGTGCPSRRTVRRLAELLHADR